MAPKISSILGILLATQAFAAVPNKLELDAPSSEVKFTAVGKPSLLRIKGEGAHATGSLEEKAGRYLGSIVVDLNEFHTGIAMRDKHMKEKYLELGKAEFAKAELKLVDLESACLGAAAGSPKPCPFTGTLTLHGFTHSVSGTASAKEEGGARKISAEWTLKLSEYGINVPQFAGVTVADEVQISADVKARVP